MTTYLNTEITIALAPITCGVTGCGIPFAITKSLQDAALADHSLRFYCPNGHCVGYSGKSTADRLRAAETREVALRDQLEASAREAETVRVALLRDRQRFANGVCPCCNRSFDNVRRHMTTKHPDYDVTKVHQPSAVRFTCSCSRTFKTLQGLRIHQGSQRRDNWAAPGATSYSAHLTKV